MESPSDPRTDPYFLIAALLFLQVQFARQRRPEIAAAVDDHLDRLESAASSLPAILASALPRLHEQWSVHILGQPYTPGRTTAIRRGVVIPFPIRPRR